MSRCCSLQLCPGIGLAGHLCGEFAALVTSIGSSALDFPLGESVLEPPACHLVLALGECTGLVESGSGAGGVMVLKSGAKAMVLSGMGTVVEVTYKPLSTYVGMSKPCCSS